MKQEELKQAASDIRLGETQKARLLRRLAETPEPERKTGVRRIAVPVGVCAAAALAFVLAWNVTHKTAVPAPAQNGNADMEQTVTQEKSAEGRSQTEQASPQTEVQPAEAPVSQTSAQEYNGGAEVVLAPDQSVNRPFSGEWNPDTLIRDYPEVGPLKYYAPKAGDWILSPALSRAMEVNGSEGVQYLLRITVLDYAAEHPTPESQEAFYLAEADRIGLNDQITFMVETATDKNGNKAVTFSAVLHDPAFLADFPAAPTCGYIIELYDEQSAVK